MPLAIVGQAPSRKGPGRAFSGPSGDRLIQLLGVENYLELYKIAHLENLLTDTQEKLPHGRGDRFDMEEAKKNAKISLLCMLFLNKNTQVIACGHKVYKAYTGQKGTYFKGVRVKDSRGNTVDIWCFPHPSGASPFWNWRPNVVEAAKFIRKVRDRAAKLDAQ